MYDILGVSGGQRIGVGAHEQVGRAVARDEARVARQAEGRVEHWVAHHSIDAHAPANSVIGSSTSGLLPSDMQTAMKKHPERLVGEDSQCL